MTLRITEAEYAAILARKDKTPAQRAKCDRDHMRRHALHPATEDEVQAAIVKHMRLRGCKVMITSRRRKACRKCGAYSSGGDGVSRGVADLLIRIPHWGRNIWIMVECKAHAKADVSDEQRELEIQGGLSVAWTVEMAWSAVMAADRSLQGIGD